MWLLAVGLLATYGLASTISSVLEDPVPVKAVFYEFERTLTVRPIIDEIIKRCDPECSYAKCECESLSETFLSMSENRAGKKMLNSLYGDDDRRARLTQHFETLARASIPFHVVLTTKYNIAEEDMKSLIVDLLDTMSPEFVGISPENILVARDPLVDHVKDGKIDAKEEDRRFAVDQEIVETVLIKGFSMDGVDAKEALFVGSDREQVELFIRNTSFQTLFPQKRGMTAALRQKPIPRPEPGMDAGDMAFIEARATMEGDGPGDDDTHAMITRDISWDMSSISAVIIDFETILPGLAEKTLKECMSKHEELNFSPNCSGQLELSNTLEQGGLDALHKAIGEEVLDPLKDFFRRLNKSCTAIYIIARSVGEVPAHIFKNFVFVALQMAGRLELVMAREGGDALDYIITVDAEQLDQIDTRHLVGRAQHVISNNPLTEAETAMFVTNNIEYAMDMITTRPGVAGRPDLEIAAETVYVNKLLIGRVMNIPAVTNTIDFIMRRAEDTCPFDATPENMWDFCDEIARTKACAKDCAYAFSEPALIKLMPESLIIDICNEPEGKYVNLCPNECGTPYDLREVCGLVEEKGKCLEDCKYIFSDSEFNGKIPDRLAFEICTTPQGDYKKLCPTECGEEVESEPKPFKNYQEFALFVKTTAKDEPTCKAMKGKWKSKRGGKCIAMKEKKVKCKNFSKTADLCSQLGCSIKKTRKGDRCTGTPYSK